MKGFEEEDMNRGKKGWQFESKAYVYTSVQFNPDVIDWTAFFYSNHVFILFVYHHHQNLVKDIAVLLLDITCEHLFSSKNKKKYI